MPANFSQDEFLERLEFIFGDKYDFTNVEYKNAKTKVWVSCRKHGDISMDPQTLLYKKIGCRECQKERVRLSRRDSQDSFIQKCKKLHGEKFDYSRIKYVDSKTSILIGCKIHGLIEKIAIKFRKNGCSLSNEEKRLSAQRISTKKFIQKAKLVHGHDYTFKNTKYINSKTDVFVKCKIHGEFKVILGNFLKGKGCGLCGKEKRIKKRTLSTRSFVERAIAVHGEKYTYKKTNYINAHIHLVVTCKEHGDFKVTPSNHLWNKRGCSKCSGRKSSVGYKNLSKRIDQEEFLKRAKKIHKHSKYDFSQSNYITQYEDVYVICNYHGEFNIKGDLS